MHFVKPRLSEKAYAMSQATNTYVVDVPQNINKYEVADALNKQFGVTVVSVRLVSRKGKVKRVMNLTGKRSSNRTGTQPDIKKAYVTLAEGSHLPFFEAEEKAAVEATKEAEKSKKTAKKSEAKTDDKADKADKPAKKEKN